MIRPFDILVILATIALIAALHFAPQTNSSRVPVDANGNGVVVIHKVQR